MPGGGRKGPPPARRTLPAAGLLGRPAHGSAGAGRRGPHAGDLCPDVPCSRSLRPYPAVSRLALHHRVAPVHRPPPPPPPEGDFPLPEGAGLAGGADDRPG